MYRGRRFEEKLQITVRRRRVRSSVLFERDFERDVYLSRMAISMVAHREE